MTVTLPPRWSRGNMLASSPIDFGINTNYAKLKMTFIKRCVSSRLVVKVKTGSLGIINMCQGRETYPPVFVTM